MTTVDNKTNDGWPGATRDGCNVRRLTRAPRSALVQQVGGFGGPVGEDGVGAGSADRGEGFEDGAFAVQPAVGGGGFDHGVLAGDVVRGNGDVHVVADLADDVEVGEGRLDHDEVGAFGEVEVDLADRVAGVGVVLLVRLPVAGERR